MGGADLLFCLYAERLNERLKRIPPLDKIHSQGGHMLATTTQVPTRAHVTPETDLADLRAIKSAWIQASRDLAYPNLAWKVVRNLGRREKFGVLRETYYWEALDGKVRLLGDENTVKYSPQHRAYVVRRYVAAYVMPEMFETRFAKPEQAIMSGHQVLRWAWLMADTPDGSLCEEDESQQKNFLLFIPGQWANEILRVQAETEAVIKAAAQEKAEADRQQLLAELLFGVEV
jgi:hypothetical protein